MILGFLALKVGASVALVVLLSVVTERASPRVAGVLAGVPTSTGLTLLFYGLELGDEFAAQAAVYNIIGLSVTLAFCLGFYQMSKRGFGVVASSLWGFAAYIPAAIAASSLKLDVASASAMSLIVIAASILYLRGVHNTKLTSRVRLTPAVLAARALTASLFIVSITAAAAYLPPSSAGVLSAFPSTIYPLLVIVSMTYGTPHVHTILRNVPRGLVSVVVFSAMASYTISTFGTIFGVALSAVAAMAYLILYAVHAKSKGDQAA